MRRSAGERRRAGEQRRARRAPPIEIHSAGEKTAGGVARGAAAARAASGERRGTRRATAPRLGQALRRASSDEFARVEVPATQKHGGQRGQVMCESAHAARVPELETRVRWRARISARPASRSAHPSAHSAPRGGFAPARVLPVYFFSDSFVRAALPDAPPRPTRHRRRA